ncbi:MAG: Asp23/Gls24 family envelope stress response protein [Firmicutes bacterium]|nr:Asp23/Gls24 family envelope stress response protein [Bacillota bacterium]
MEETRRGEVPPVPVVQLANDVIGDIALLAAREVNGVCDFTVGHTSSTRGEVWTRRVNRPVRVEVQDRTVQLSLYLLVEYGVRIPEVAQKVQDAVKHRVEEITGLRVQSVDIHIQGVALPFEDPTSHDMSSSP